MADALDKNNPQQIAAVMVVGFHHAYGPIVEHSIPALPSQTTEEQKSLGKIELPEKWSFLPFLALPDGAHQKDKDFAYFHLPPLQDWAPAGNTTLFGISCNRQIASKDLLVKTPDITRVIVQKAIVVLAKQPIFGPLREKLAISTASWFAQRDFTNLDILNELYANLSGNYCRPIDDSELYMGTCLRELVYMFKSKTLTMLKLLLLEKRILFYGYPVERLCTFQYSLISLVPGLLRNLKDSGSPELDTAHLIQAPSSSSETRESLGLPLHLFEKGSFFQPYLALQQIDMLSSDQTTSYVAGTTNQIFFHQKSDTKIDVLVNVETGTLEFYDPQLLACVNQTLSDRRWMESIVKAVNDTYHQNDPISKTHVFKGSDDYLRGMFETYIRSLLSSVKHAQVHHQLDDIWNNPEAEEIMLDENEEHNYLSDYGMRWLEAWMKTDNFKKWNHYTDNELFEFVEPGHPGRGHLSITDLQNTLSNRLRDLQLKQNLVPIKNTLSKAMSGSAKAVSRSSTKFMKGMDALLNDPVTESPASSQPNNNNNLFSSISSFWSKTTKEFSQNMEEAMATNRRQKASGPTPKIASPKVGSSDDDDSGSAFVNIEHPSAKHS
ncbi:transport protein Avl9-domain-containing protein [Sporodiniella umbellata]|nr:transport protein Avl9-domain-containing protein [Sporodiniella umbellata]